MAHYTASIETPRAPAEAFAYLSDFSTTQEWDPGVVEAQRIGDAPVGEGTEFRIADPLLGLAFDRVGDRALEGLRAAIGSRQPTRLPRLSGRSLDGRHHQLPEDLRAQHTFLVAAFRREQQALVDEWLPWLIDLQQRRADVVVYELPILSALYSPARWFIDGGMARGVGTDAARARTITVYTDVGKAVRELGLSGTETIGVLLVDRSGRVLAREHGGFDDRKAARLAAALERPGDEPREP